MSKFNKGDWVRVVWGIHKGCEGVVIDPYWKVSASDWPLVIFEGDDGRRMSDDEDYIALVKSVDEDEQVEKIAQALLEEGDFNSGSAALALARKLYARGVRRKLT